MKKYDFKSIKRFIQKHSDYIDEVSIGMLEDWFWTAEIIYSNGKFEKELDKDGIEIGGLTGSDWATPSMKIEWKDGRTEIKNCYTGKSGGQKPEWFQLGCLSGPCQESINDIKTPKIP